MGTMKRMHTQRSPAAGAAALPVRSPLAGLDLNLLVALDALLGERSVTRAAWRLGVTQSALSHALARLRQLFADPLLVRTPRHMAPTALALDLAEPLRHTLAGLEETLRTRPRFDPATSQRQFRIASADYAMLVLLPQLMARVAAAAPAVSVTVVPATPASTDELTAGQLDLILGAIPPDVPDLVGRRLFEERFVCLVRRDHPTVRKALTLDEYVRLKHVLISPIGGGVTWVDPVLQQLGHKRDIALRVPHFLIAPLIVAETDLILTVAARVARTLGAALPVREVAPPIAIPRFTLSMYWHPQRSEDPGHRWLRERLLEVAGEVSRDDGGRKQKRRPRR